MFHLTRTEATHYVLSRDSVETLLGYDIGEADGKTDIELARELERELDGEHGFMIVDDLPRLDPGAEVVQDSNTVSVEPLND